MPTRLNENSGKIIKYEYISQDLNCTCGTYFQKKKVYDKVNPGFEFTPIK